MGTDLITTAEAAKILKRSQRWVQSLILRGKLKAEEVGDRYVLRRGDVKKYRHQKRGQPSKNGTRRKTQK